MLKKILLTGVLLVNSYGNELKNEDSPYLQQHADNPVNWMPWGEKALEKAKREKKLIFLSIGYSTCHWCHVMEHESFENEAIAKQLNENFVTIKVDREEYPNIDKYYQEVYRRMNNRSGGWPLTVILTPNAKVFFTATYIPAVEKYGYKGLPEVLSDIHKLYKEEKKSVEKSAEDIASRLNLLKTAKKSSATLDSNLSNIFLAQVEGSYDHEYKGIGQEPKFPHATSFDTLLDIARLEKNHHAKELATDALKAMIKGGINDQIEGGFYRYSTDEMWMIPHFEKMLYTNAELLETMANAYVLTKEPIFKESINATIANIYERFEKNNLFYSASDADSDGEEGKYFLFTYDKVAKALKSANFSKEEIDEALSYFNISKIGNFEDEENNPYIDSEEKPKHLVELKSILKKIRAKRNYPFIDHKVQTSWNSLFIHALFKAGEDEKAVKSLDALVENLYVKGVLYHQMLIGKIPKVKAYLEDYAFLVQALLDAHQATLEKRYLELAERLSSESLKKFYKKEVWYMSDDSFKSVADLYDASYRSAKAVSIENLLKLSMLHDDFDAYVLAKKMLGEEAETLNAMPASFAYATKVALMVQNPLVLLHSTKGNLLKNKNILSTINYPYVLLKEGKESDFSACTMEKCFSTHKELSKVIGDIERL